MVLTESGQQLAIGDKAPAFALKGIDGKLHTLDEYRGKVLLIIFMCNHCPYVRQKFTTINELAKRFSGDVAVVGINSNDADAYPEDSYEAMQATAREEGFVFDYLYDATQEVARSYGATCTPDPFLFTADHRLAWHGRLDDALQLHAKPTKQDMAEAIETVLAGRAVAKPFLPSIGCNIKWKTEHL
ncbi:thioredoxin family protein [Candidatus Woesearchaeota archaeon]|nr:MAG: thioredoxin family protein [Candidatus Woesearchaeota archaeon]